MKKVSPRTQIIILSSVEDENLVLEVIKAGAISYLLKDIDPSELIETIYAASRNESRLSPKIASLLMLAVGRKPLPHENLTEREHQVLKLLADGFSNLAISSQLEISERTVKAHVSNILSKLYLADRVQAAAYAWKNKLVE